MNNVINHTSNILFFILIGASLLAVGYYLTKWAELPIVRFSHATNKCISVEIGGMFHNCGVLPTKYIMVVNR